MKKTKQLPLMLLAKHTVEEMQKNTYPDPSIAYFLSGWFSAALRNEVKHLYIVVELGEVEKINGVHPNIRDAIKIKRMFKKQGKDVTVVKL